MQSIKRDLATGLSVSALAFACAIAWGSPFVASGVNAPQAQEPQQTQPQPDQAQPQQQPDQAQPQPDQAPAKTFTGTIMKNGSNFVLRDVSGHVFKLDDPDSAKPYVGKSVKVIGQLDEQAMLIHVQSIEGTAA